MDEYHPPLVQINIGARLALYPVLVSLLEPVPVLKLFVLLTWIIDSSYHLSAKIQSQDSYNDGKQYVSRWQIFSLF